MTSKIDQTTKPAYEFAKAHEIKLDATKIGTLSGSKVWANGTKSYRVKLSSTSGIMTVSFKMGPAHKDSPTIYDVLCSLRSDFQCVESSRNIDDFASDLGITKSSEAIKAWDACNKEKKDFISAFGLVAYNELLDADIA